MIKTVNENFSPLTWITCYTIKSSLQIFSTLKTRELAWNVSMKWIKRGLLHLVTQKYKNHRGLLLWIIIPQKPGHLEEMDKYLQTYNLPRLNHDETENMNRPITIKETKSMIKNFPTNKSFAGEFHQIFKKHFSTNPSQTL